MPHTTSMSRSSTRGSSEASSASRHHPGEETAGMPMVLTSTRPAAMKNEDALPSVPRRDGGAISAMYSGTSTLDMPTPTPISRRPRHNTDITANTDQEEAAAVPGAPSPTAVPPLVPTCSPSI